MAEKSDVAAGEDTLIDETVAPGIAILKVNRPGKRNALSTALYNSLTAVLQKHSRAGTKVLILSGAGRCFCGGMDLEDILESRDHLAAARRFMKTLATYKSMIVAAVHGACVGIGATMLLHFDAVFAAENTTLSTPFRTLGIAPEFGSTVLFPMHLGSVLTSRMLYMGETVRAEDWQRVGAITQIVGIDAEQVLGHSVQYAKNLIHGAASDEWDAVILAKALVNSRKLKLTLEAMDREFTELDRAFVSGEPQARIEARVAEIKNRHSRL